MRWAALYRRPPILRGVSASQIRADHAVNQARDKRTLRPGTSKFLPVARMSLESCCSETNEPKLMSVPGPESGIDYDDNNCGWNTSCQAVNPHFLQKGPSPYGSEMPIAAFSSGDASQYPYLCAAL